MSSTGSFTSSGRISRFELRIAVVAVSIIKGLWYFHSELINCPIPVYSRTSDLLSRTGMTVALCANSHQNEQTLVHTVYYAANQQGTCHRILISKREHYGDETTFYNNRLHGGTTSVVIR